MGIPERIEIVKGYEKTKRVWRSNYNSVEFVETSKLNVALFGMPLNHAAKCQCIEDLFYYINNLTIEKLTQKIKTMSSNFKLKKDTVIALHGLNEAITNGNLTDEKAIELLKKYPGHHVSFEVLPENWEELCGKETKKEEAKKEDGEADKKGSQVDFLLTKKKKELIDLCKKDAKKYPVKEWEELTQKELAQYISDKLV